MRKEGSQIESTQEVDELGPSRGVDDESLIEGNPTATNLQRLDRRVAAPMILRQGGAVQPHGVFVLLIVTVKLAHQTTHKVLCVVAIASLDAHILNVLTRIHENLNECNRVTC